MRTPRTYPIEQARLHRCSDGKSSSVVRVVGTLRVNGGPRTTFGQCVDCGSVRAIRVDDPPAER